MFQTIISTFYAYQKLILIQVFLVTTTIWQYQVMIYIDQTTHRRLNVRGRGGGVSINYKKFIPLKVIDIQLWLATCTWKPKVPSLSPAASYVQRWAFCSNPRLVSKCLWSEWKWYWGVKEMPSPFPLQYCGSLMSVKENPDRKKNESIVILNT